MKSRLVIVIGLAVLCAAGCKGVVECNDPYFLDGKLCFQLRDSRLVHRTMQEFTEDSGMARWEAKEVLESRQLPLASDFQSLKIIGYSEDACILRTDSLVTHSGEPSVCIDVPASGPVKNPSNRNYGMPGILRPLDGEDLRDWNRFSCWVYVDAPGYYISFLGFGLLNEGEKPTPTPGRFEGTHYVSVHPGEWTHIIWEIPDLYRDKVTGFEVCIMMNGETAGASERMRLYVDDMRIDKVEAENSRGFDLRRGAIAYSHDGYRKDSRKQALVQNCSAEKFLVRDDRTGRVAFRGRCEPLEGGFSLMDFSPLDRSGRYTLEVGDLSTKPFFIGSAAYLATAWHLVNFFFSERCGFDQPGIHDPCHEDVYVYHPDGRHVSISGGWHDAADLTQGTGNNCEAGVALLELADEVRDSDPKLYERVLEEARWGLNWMLKTRLGDGYRIGGLIIGIWTKNIRGDKDDMQGTADRNPLSNFRSAEYEAMAFRHFEKMDPVFAYRLREAAVEDFDYAMQELDSHTVGADSPVAPYASKNETEISAMALTSAMRLYDLTAEKKYLDIAATLARRVMAAQEMELHSDWSIPLRGFFYEASDHVRPIQYYHQSQEHRMVQGLALLLKACPQHPDASQWLASLEAYSDYLKAVSGVMEPYGLLPAAVYEVGNTDYSNLYHEGEKTGLPTMEEYNAQVRNGIHLGGDFYLRRFPVSYQFRGFNAVCLAKAKAAFIVAEALSDAALKDIAMRQVEWITGWNPFAMDTIYGDGYDYPLLYGAYAGNVVGAVPVGIETFENDDEPYFPMQSNCTYKEIWTHSTARMISCVAEIFKNR